MNPLLSYTLHVSGAFALFYLAYRLFLSSDTFFVRNRFYFLGAMLVSIIAPLLKFKIKVTAPITEPANIYVFNNFEKPTVTPIPIPEMNYWTIAGKVLVWIYLAGVVLYLVRFVWAYHKVIRLIITSERKQLKDMILVITPLSVSPFSLLKWLVVQGHQVDHPHFENIVQHESIHSRQYHSVDLFLAELLVAAQWFNPFAWWLKKSMVENHEFIVDQVLLRNGMDPQHYQYSLVNFSTGNSQLAVVNYFNANLLKKRIRMMNKNKSPKWHGIKNVSILLTAIVVVALTASFDKVAVAQNAGSDPLVIVNGRKSTMKTFEKINPESIQSVNVIKDSSAIAKYGQEARNGVMEVETKDTISKIKSNRLEDIKVIGYGTQVDSTKARTNTKFKHDRSEDIFLGYAINHLKYPKEAIDINLQATVNIAFTFNPNGIEMPKKTMMVSDEYILKEIVVIAYPNEETGKHLPADPNSEALNLLQNEVANLAKTFTQVPQDLVGKTFVLPVKFLLIKSPTGDDVKSLSFTGIRKSSDRKDINANIIKIEPVDKTKASQEKILILNDEKIITDAEMQKLDASSIVQISVFKEQKIEHKTLGTLEGKLIFITTKK